MKLSVVDVEEIIRTTVFSSGILIPFSFDDHTNRDATASRLGDLFQQDNPFFTFRNVILNSKRVGPTKTAPTRYFGDLFITYLTKKPSSIKDAKLLEGIANKFAEQTLDGIRFRTYTPYPVSKDNGFTAYAGVIDFDFELYRGG